jgi:hypothetical protein
MSAGSPAPSAAAKAGTPGERIIARYRKDAAMPDVLRGIADCSWWSGASEPCGAHLPDLDDDVARRDAEAYMTDHARSFRPLSDARRSRRQRPRKSHPCRYVDIP